MQEIEITGDEPRLNIYIIRKTFYGLLFRLLWIEIYMAILFFITRFLLFVSEEFISEIISVDVVYALVISMISILNIFLIVRAIGRWLGFYYVIKPNEIHEVRGVFSSKEIVCPLMNVEWVEVKQGLFGKLLNYGKIIIHSPILKENFVLNNVPSPKKYRQHIFTYYKTSVSQIIRSANK